MNVEGGVGVEVVWIERCKRFTSKVSGPWKCSKKMGNMTFIINTNTVAQIFPHILVRPFFCLGVD